MEILRKLCQVKRGIGGIRLSIVETGSNNIVRLT